MTIAAKRTGPCGVWALNSDNPPANLPSAQLTSTLTQGCSMRIGWGYVEASQGVRDWSYFDTNIASCVANKKRVMLRVFTTYQNGLQPLSWMVNAGMLMFPFTSSGGNPATVQVPWDTTFLGAWTALVAAFGAKYNNNSQVDMIHMAGADFTGGEMHLEETSADVTRWGTSPYLYTPTKLVNAWKTIVDAYNYAFPNKMLCLNVSTPISSSDNVVEDVMDYCFSKIGERFSVQHNALAAKTVPAPGHPQVWVNRGAYKCTTGYQQLNSMIDDPVRWCGGLGTPPNTANAFNLELGLVIGAGTPSWGQYCEAYTHDWEDATLFASWNKYFPGTT